ncbi:MAG: hemerythrin [Desulfobacterium sp.]|nr:hemerythrin [Desulfobacterium sp.]
MPIITWTEDMLVHVEKIDTQHKKLLVLLNDLNDAMNQGRDKKVLGNTIIALADYTYYHFMTEEKYFDQFQYPDSIRHKNEHQYFVEEVTRFQQQFDKGETKLSEDIILFLKSWVINHIMKSDQKFSPFLNARGIT